MVFHCLLVDLKVKGIVLQHLDLSDNLSASLRDIMFVALLFMLHVPLDRFSAILGRW